jgi:hypothetical protein
MNPRPSLPNFKRLEQRRKVTLIAGLKCRDAIVFPADSEESGGVRKSNVEKMHRVPESGMVGVLSHDPKRNTSIVVAGAGNGTLCDFAMQRITDMVRATTKHDGALKVIEAVLIDIWKVHVPLFPAHDSTETDFRLLIGIRAPDSYGPHLYSVHGTTIVERDKYFSWGSGSVTDYILDQMYSEPMSVEDGIAAALYMLQIAKKYVSGVGGESHISILKADGAVDDKPPWEISEEENIATSFSQTSGALLLSLLRTRSGTEVNFINHLKAFDKTLHHLRKKKKASDKFMDEFMQHLEEQKKSAKPVEPKAEGQK